MTPTTETWLPVLGYEDNYEVSNLGRVRSLDRKIVRSDGHPKTLRGQVLSLGVDTSGRPVVTIQIDNRRRTARVSVLVLQAFVGPRPDGMVGCHNNGDCTDNRATNLRWDTPSANELDKRTHGTHYLVNRTHCPQRHPLIEPNLIPSALRLGLRNCLACGRARNRRRTARKHGLPFDLQYEADLFFAEIMKEPCRD